MEQLNLKELMRQIEALRNYMYELIRQKKLHDPEILEVSQQLDELLIKYYELLKDKY
jgi:hypothetical protein